MTTYSPLANSPLVDHISFTNTGSLRMMTTKTYDHFDRLARPSSVPSASSAVEFGYAYSSANQSNVATQEKWAAVVSDPAKRQGIKERAGSERRR